MKARCRPFQVAWMEARDEGRPTPAGDEAHLAECPDCRTWIRYLEAERQAVAHWTPPPVAGRVWVRTLLRPRPTPSPVWAWTLTGLAALGLSVGLWATVYRPVSGPFVRESTAEIPRWAEPWVGLWPETETNAEGSMSSLLEESGIWWTEDDLQALELPKAPPSASPPAPSFSHRRPERLPLDFRDASRLPTGGRYVV